NLADVRQRHRAHHEIFDAILSHEPLQAETLMRAHVASVKASVVRAFSRRAGCPAELLPTLPR
ncbi:MAG TPA: hypothetical protein VGF36_02320, partial [Rhodopila sp.]